MAFPHKLSPSAIFPHLHLIPQSAVVLSFFKHLWNIPFALLTFLSPSCYLIIIASLLVSLTPFHPLQQAIASTRLAALKCCFSLITLYPKTKAINQRHIVLAILKTQFHLPILAFQVSLPLRMGLNLPYSFTSHHCPLLGILSSQIVILIAVRTHGAILIPPLYLCSRLPS